MCRRFSLPTPEHFDPGQASCLAVAAFTAQIRSGTTLPAPRCFIEHRKYDLAQPCLRCRGEACLARGRRCCDVHSWAGGRRMRRPYSSDKHRKYELAQCCLRCRGEACLGPWSAVVAMSNPGRAGDACVAPTASSNIANTISPTRTHTHETSGFNAPGLLWYHFPPQRRDREKSLLRNSS